MSRDGMTFLGFVSRFSAWMITLALLGLAIELWMLLVMP